MSYPYTVLYQPFTHNTVMLIVDIFLTRIREDRFDTTLKPLTVKTATSWPTVQLLRRKSKVKCLYICICKLLQIMHHLNISYAILLLTVDSVLNCN